MIKPSNVYGLPWDKYMACVKKEMRGGLGAELVERVVLQAVAIAAADTLLDALITLITNASGSLEPEMKGDSDHSKTARWARMWREQNSARMQARRERKRSHQMSGLWQLAREMEALDEDNN
ncbi:unnamed protein product [Schistocephalus solidus]|uniref:Phage protein n=1 Tax=Schistocephalus solidus TaxID=70667 RepID=A0A183SMG0_SCHSO|nr:unnamed protein product [Schistocephalus solidus]